VQLEEHVYNDSLKDYMGGCLKNVTESKRAKLKDEIHHEPIVARYPHTLLCQEDEADTQSQPDSKGSKTKLGVKAAKSADTLENKKESKPAAAEEEAKKATDVVVDKKSPPVVAATPVKKASKKKYADKKKKVDKKNYNTETQDSSGREK